MNVIFFASQSDLRTWLEANHDRATELQIGFYKKASGKGGITYHEALDEALCFGWIDGVRKGIDDVSSTIRFTPRRPKSNWSAVNIKRVGELIELGLMHPAGVAAFERRDQSQAAHYSYENDARSLDADCEARFRANPAAWDFFQAQPPGYRRTASWWVMSGKKEETRLRRLATLIEGSEKRERLGVVTGQPKR